MSAFKCEKCGKTCIDSNDGFISGCKHYHPDIKNTNAGFTVGNNTKKENK